ncbi:MAG TPA: HD domain-containing protein [Phenylobacterium sp.]
MPTIDGVAIPDSRLCREITELARDTQPDMLFNHSTRVYYFGALAGARRELNFDRELLYAGSMFHDAGVLPEFRSETERFEVDGANAARDFLKARGIAPSDIELVWLAIALHTSRGIPNHLHPTIALLTEGVVMDVVGVGYDAFTTAQRDAVVAAYPRTRDFEEDLIQAFYDGIKHKPQTTFGNVNADVLADKDPHFHRGDYCSVIRGSRWRREQG